jgi:hypothetical protein
MAWKVSHKTQFFSVTINFDHHIRYRYAPYTDKNMKSLLRHTKRQIRYHYYCIKFTVFLMFMTFLYLLTWTEVNKAPMLHHLHLLKYLINARNKHANELHKLRC